MLEMEVRNCENRENRKFCEIRKNHKVYEIQQLDLFVKSQYTIAMMF